MKTPRTPLVFDISRSPVTADEVARTSAPALKPPTVPRQQLGARIPVDVYKRLRVRAVMDGVLVQDLIERAIIEFLDRG
jgi:hypothetical protein